MKETGIIMSGNHPKLIIDLIKTMTRRTAGLNEINKAPDKWDFMRINNDGRALFWRTSETASDKYCDPDNIRLITCPYGQVGDRLWVRETWFDVPEHLRPPSIVYKSGQPYCSDREDEISAICFRTLELEWRPSIHMPRWASRITLEITEVRVERVRDIMSKPQDSIAEGVFPDLPMWHNFAILWDTLNAKRGYGWEVNPWVFPISFKVVKP